MKAAQLTRFATVAALAVANLMLAGHAGPVRAEDTDIFTVNRTVTSERPNVLIIQDNSANWNTPFVAEKAALVQTVLGLDDRYNVGLMQFVSTGSPNSNVDGSFVRAGVRRMTDTNKTALSNLVNAFDILGDKSNNAVYGLTMAEVYRYFGGLNATTTQVKRDAAGNVLTSANTSGGASYAQSNAVYALPGNAFASMSPTPGTYVSPIADNCAKNFIIFISNGPANDNNSATTTATTALAGYGGNTATIPLSPNGSQSNVADEWARFMANTDVNATYPLSQTVVTYTVDVNPGQTGQGPGHTALLKMMAQQGKGKYFAVTSNADDIAAALNQIFTEVLAINSVFAASTLPASVNTRGTFLNQLYMGMFRPDANASPRWVGNLKQFKTAPNASGNLVLVDSLGAAVEDTTNGFLKNNITTYWTTASTFWDATYYPDAQGVGGVSDAPDGNLVEKGGAAQRLREVYGPSPYITGRNVYTCTGACAAGSTLSSYPFSTTNTALDSTALGITSTISGVTITRAGTTATAAASAHGFVTGQNVSIAGADQSEYNGLFTIAVVDANSFTFTVPENPTSPASGAIQLSRPAVGFSISALSRAATSSDLATGTTDTATATTSTAHGLGAGATVVISGATQAEYNGSFTVISAPTTTSFTFAVPVNPGTPATVNGSSAAKVGTSTKTISSLVRSGKTVTVTTTSNHGFANTGTVVISGVTPTTYNGSFAYTKTGNKTFTYALTSLTPVTPATGTISGDGTPATTTLTSLTRPSGSSLVTGTTSSAHGLAVGSSIIISGATQTAYNGTYAVVDVLSATQFTYNVTVAPTTPATGSITATATGSTNPADLINWVRGENRLLDDNPSTAVAADTFPRGYLHGDVVHSRPAIVNYNRNGDDDDVVVFYGSNDGIFHAVQGGRGTTGGNELWGFVAPEFFKSFNRLYGERPVIDNANSSTSKPYFMDGPISTLTIDVNNDGRLVSGDNDKVYLYASPRRGGRFLYAIDVSNPAAPTLLWKIDNTLPGFAELGQVWGEAKVGKIKGYTNPVLFLTAGYDPVANDTSVQVAAATMGRGVFIIDAITGAPLWHAGHSTAVATGMVSQVVSGMDYAIVADAAIIDSDSDGNIDRLYLADTGGNIWRANIGAVTGGGVPDMASWTVDKLASLASTGTDARRFLFAPDVVAFDGPPVTLDAVLIGSGDREHPFDISITNQFYMIKDGHDMYYRPTSVTQDDLYDATADLIQVGDADQKAAAQASLDAASGWYVTLGVGEKVVTPSITVSGTTVFGTNLPESTLDNSLSCSAGLGEARIYSVSFKDASSVIDQNASGTLTLVDRYAKVPGGGLPPPPVAISVMIDGQYYEGVSTGPTIITPPGPLLRKRKRIFWSIENESN